MFTVEQINARTLRAGLCLAVFSLFASSNAEAVVLGLKSCGSNSTGFCGSGIIENSLPPTSLFSFQDDGSVFADIGAVTFGGSDIDADALAYSDVYGLLAFELEKSGFSTTGSSLISINSGTAIATSIGATLQNRDIRGAVFDQTDILWTLDSYNNELLQIDPVTGAIIGSPISLSLAGTSYDLPDVTDIAVSRDDSFYLTDSDSFFTVGILTGHLTSVNSDTGQGLAGISFSNNESMEALFAYEVNGTDDIFQYEIHSAFSQALIYADIISTFNSGRGDLASYIGAQAAPEPTSSLLLLCGVLSLVGARIIVK